LINTVDDKAIRCACFSGTVVREPGRGGHGKGGENGETPTFGEGFSGLADLSHSFKVCHAVHHAHCRRSTHDVKD